jgi:hypothetical protein
MQNLRQAIFGRDHEGLSASLPSKSSWGDLIFPFYAWHSYIMQIRNTKVREAFVAIPFGVKRYRYRHLSSAAVKFPNFKSPLSTSVLNT